MARTARLALLAGAVLLAHAVVIDRVAERLQFGSKLQAMAQPMYTRVVVPQEPSFPRRRESKASPRGSLGSPPPRGRRHVAAPVEPPPTEVAQAPPPPSLPPDQQATPPELLSQPEAEAKVDLESWPTDTRLNYRLGGQFRGGPLFGDARVQWQREGAKYQVRAEIDVVPWAHLVMTSQGDVVADGLAPRIYEEESRSGRRRRAQLEDDYVRLDNGTMLPRPRTVQDTASQFIELGHRFATGATPLVPGEPVSVWLARPGGVDLWTYDVTGPEPLSTPKLGTIEAYHLKPRPIANARGNIYAEMWFAPTLQHLPVRIRILMGEVDYIDLTVESVEQR